MNLRTFGLIFFIRKERASKKNKDLSPIYVRITVNGIRSEVAMKKFVHPDKWDSSSSKVMGTNEDAKKTNEYLDKEKAKIFNIKDELLNKGENITAELIKKKYLGVLNPGRTFLGIFKEHNKNLNERIGNDIAKATSTRYATTYDHTESYIKHQYGKNDLPLEQIDHEFISGFEHYLKTKKDKCSHNTTMKYLSNIRKITNIAINSDWLIKDPFRKFPLSFKKIDHEFLLWDELQRIESLDIKIERLELVRDLFVFACYTAFEYIDIEEVSTSHFHKESDGNEWIVKKRHKGGITCIIPVFQKTKMLLNKYKDNSDKKEDRLLPVLSNQKLNSYLKEIVDLCGIKKDVCFLTARRTFASVVGFKMGLSPESIRMVMGHSDLTMTSTYSQPDKTKIINDLKAYQNESK